MKQAQPWRHRTREASKTQSKTENWNLSKPRKNKRGISERKPGGLGCLNGASNTRMASRATASKAVVNHRSHVEVSVLFFAEWWAQKTPTKYWCLSKNKVESKRWKRYSEERSNSLSDASQAVPKGSPACWVPHWPHSLHMPALAAPANISRARAQGMELIKCYCSSLALWNLQQRTQKVSNWNQPPLSPLYSCSKWA